MSRHLRHVPRRLAPREWVVSVSSAVLAIAAVVVGTDLGKFHGPSLHARIIAWISAVVLAVAGTVAVRRLSTGLSHLVTPRSHLGAAAIVRFVMSGLGFLILIFSLFAVFGVSLQHLLIGAGVTGIVLGIAAQQSLGNVFASLVLLFARPFVVGDRIRLRSGAIGTLDATVVGIGLTYVTLQTDEGVLRVPNSAMLASGIGHLTTPSAVSGTAAAGRADAVDTP
jgi:small-conductance mechanosensitive channel